MTLNDNQKDVCSKLLDALNDFIDMMNNMDPSKQTEQFGVTRKVAEDLHSVICRETGIREDIYKGENFCFSKKDNRVQKLFKS